MFAHVYVDEFHVANSDETHFIMNVENSNMHSFRGDDEVKFVDVLSRVEGITMHVRFTSGRNAHISQAFTIFLKKHRNYPIKGVPA